MSRTDYYIDTRKSNTIEENVSKYYFSFMRKYITKHLILTTIEFKNS